MQTMAAHPIEVRRLGTHAIHIVWSDGHVSEFQNTYLRNHCPCAECHELQRPKRLPMVGNKEELFARQIGVVGRYALSMQWTDGHDSGIYSYKTLRALCPCEQCNPTSGLQS